MSDFIEDSYPFELVDQNPYNWKYDFVSIGTESSKHKKVPKRVIISVLNIKGFESYYNLGLANIKIDKNGFERLSDMSRDNNKNDKDKVLKTVFTCALDFLSYSPDAKLVFFGNTFAKHRLYKIGLNQHLESIEKYFVIKAGIIPNLKVNIDENGRKTPSLDFDPTGVIYEAYLPTKSKFYNFITIELKTIYK